jgi:hypothetical protein
VRSWLIAHQQARVVNSPRGRAIRSSCSVNDRLGHAGSLQRQVRFRHTIRTGRPNDGASTNHTDRRP